jgi:hypothetical protein
MRYVLVLILLLGPTMGIWAWPLLILSNWLGQKTMGWMLETARQTAGALRRDGYHPWGRQRRTPAEAPSMTVAKHG